MTARSAQIAAAFKAACQDEIESPKPGNVHIFAPGHRMTSGEFLRSAEAAAEPLARPGARVGARIQGAVEATFAAVGMNTNLGIILLCAPLAAAAEFEATDLRAPLNRVLDDLDLEDARLAFDAIVHASPAGLGRAEQHDVFAPAKVSLRAAMAAAADRDRIAQQYVSGFEDVFGLGLSLLETAIAGGRERKWATLAVYLGFLSTFPDTHVARKFGAETAESVRVKASDFLARLTASHYPHRLLEDLLAWDADLKQNAINPGTSADLAVATLFAYRLTSTLPWARKSD